MSSPVPGILLPTRTSFSSSTRSRPSATPSIADARPFSRRHRPHVHRHHVRYRDKDKDRDNSKDKEKDEKALHITNSSLQPTLSPARMETGTSRSENATPPQIQNASQRTSLRGLDAEQDGAILSCVVEGTGPTEAVLTQEREKGVLRAAFVAPFSTEIYAGYN